VNDRVRPERRLIDPARGGVAEHLFGAPPTKLNWNVWVSVTIVAGARLGTLEAAPSSACVIGPIHRAIRYTPALAAGLFRPTLHHPSMISASCP
jgi:hypothetical protein